MEITKDEIRKVIEIASLVCGDCGHSDCGEDDNPQDCVPIMQAVAVLRKYNGS